MTTAAGSAPWDLFGYFGDHRAEVLRLLWSHTWLSLLPVVLGLVVAAFMAVVLVFMPRGLTGGVASVGDIRRRLARARGILSQT